MKATGIVLLDLFSGTGGFAKGFLKAGYTFRKHYFSEVDKYAIANYSHNFNDATYAGPVETITGGIEHPDVITFGFPCQDLSVAGGRAGLEGSRSGLFFEAIRIVRQHQPRVFVFENVKGLLSSNGGKDFEIVLKAIADLGYMTVNGNCLILAGFYPKIASVCTLSDILEENPRAKFFLSRKVISRLLEWKLARWRER